MLSREREETEKKEREREGGQGQTYTTSLITGYWELLFNNVVSYYCWLTTGEDLS